jgi:hypothetical protein
MHNAADGGSASETVPTFDLPPAFAKALKPAPTKQNAVLVGLSLAAATGAIASWLGDHAGTFIETACAGSTAIYGWFWWRSLMKNSNIWKRVLVSILLAAGNAATAFYVYSVFGPKGDTTDSLAQIVPALIIGITLGAIVWIPALLLTSAIFAYSIAQQSKAIQRGRDGVDYANQATATTCFTLSTTAVVLLALRCERGWEIATPLMFGLTTICAGLWNALGSANRVRTRRRFVLAVLRGKYPELKYKASEGGGVILKRSRQGPAYRQNEVATVLAHV